MIKLLCVSDQIDPAIYNNNIKEKYNDINFVISAGDLPMEYLDFIQSNLNKPLFFVFGKHNLKALPYYHSKMRKKTGKIKNYLKNLHEFKSNKGVYIGFKTYIQDGILLAGISGTKKCKNGLNQFTEKQMYFHLLKLVPYLIINKIKYGRYLDVLVSYFPPILNDRKTEEDSGFKCLNKFIKIFKPEYLVHGYYHIYSTEDSRISQCGKTKIINVHSKYILEF